MEPAGLPARIHHPGRYTTLEPLDPQLHAPTLWPALDPALFTYLFDPPPATLHHFRASLEKKAASTDPLFFAVLGNGAALGYASFMRIEPAHRVIEIGGILFTPAIQRSPVTTEAVYLMLRHAFSLGYRRVEWKCDTRNQPSRNAALRLGFTFEGIFRRHMIVKGGNRDTAWFSMLDTEWPHCRTAFETWLDPANFIDGRQRHSLAALRSAAIG